jgi:hypothetical protein
MRTWVVGHSSTRRVWVCVIMQQRAYEGSTAVTPTAMDPSYAAELLRRQDALQAEAHRLVAELDLMTILARAGRPYQIGSSMSGLMVWRDLDFIVACSELSAAEAFETVRLLITRPDVTHLHYANQRGSRNPTGHPETERYYFVVHYETEAGATWKVDISLSVTDAPLSPPDHLRWLAEHMTEETRLAILWIKDIWHHLPSYPDEVGGSEVYDAVLEHQVRTPAQFDAYLRERGLPGRLPA